MTEKKNFYREIATLLRALPEEKRFLVKRFAHLAVTPEGQPPRICGCALGAVYPEATSFSRITDFHKAFGDPRPREFAFRVWVENLGGSADFVYAVQNANDAFACLEHPSSVAVAAERYRYMLGWLDAAAMRLDGL